MRDAPEPTGDEVEEVDMELPKVYEPVTTLEVLRERLFMFLGQYNEMVRGHGMDLVFFQDAVEHIIKVRMHSTQLLVAHYFRIIDYLDIKNSSKSWRELVARWSWRFRQAIINETGVVYRRL